MSILNMALLSIILTVAHISFEKQEATLLPGKWGALLYLAVHGQLISSTTNEHPQAPSRKCGPQYRGSLIWDAFCWGLGVLRVGEKGLRETCGLPDSAVG